MNQSVGPMNRRRFLQASGAAGLAVALNGLLGACATGKPGATASSPTTIDPAAFTPSPGSEIPKATVNFAMWPYPDGTIGYIGIDRGYFEEVGIQLNPSGGATKTSDQTAQQLLNGQLDMANGFVPLVLNSYPNNKSVKVIQFHDVNVGNYVLASPRAGAEPFQSFADKGQSFAEAMKSAIGQMKGKKVALSDSGSNRAFFDNMLNLGGLTADQFDLQVLPDSTIVQLAKAGRIDFAMPAGAAQNIEVVNAGYTRMAGIAQLLSGLPQGDPRSVGGIGHHGLAATADYIDRNTETVLRFLSVYYRIMDDIVKDPASALAISLPALRTAAGVDISLEDAEWIFKNFYEMVDFERAADHVINSSSPINYKVVYKAQIELARKGGVLPAGLAVTPEDLFIGEPLYRIALDLKGKYEDIEANGGKSGPLADLAAKHYAHRNYLDAYRLISAA
jgi:ABC-type nitrate/sulfonate/bicarbonate transport system substrate-binding protein